MKHTKKLIYLIAALLLVNLAYITFENNGKDRDNAKQHEIVKVKPIKYEGALVIPEIKLANSAALMQELDKNPSAGSGTFDLATMASEITSEAVKAFSDSPEKSLPLLASWNVGTEGMDPMYMFSRIEQGEHILVTWKLDPSYPYSYYKDSILKAQKLNMPLVFILPSPESALTKENYYFGLDATKNPNVVDINGNILEKLSPFAPDDTWKEVGMEAGQSDLLAQIQELYPNPPLVLFVSEDEAAKLKWSEVSESARYVASYGSDKDDMFKRTLIASQWIEKYRQLHEGFKEALAKADWKKNTKFISKNSYAQSMGKTATWMKDATTTSLYANVWPLTADGSSINFDLSGSKNVTSANSPQVLANNLPFMLQEAKDINPNFAFELSLNDEGKLQTPAEYRGFAQFALWFLRPSIIRQASNEATPTKPTPMFQELADSVELIHYNEQLADFWKNGTLVSNGESDLNKNIPEQYKNDPRWFLLDTDKNPPRPWANYAAIPVWAFALVKGEAPNREWLVYVQSPDGDVSGVTVSIPRYGDVLVDGSETGSFYGLKENSTTIKIKSINVSTDVIVDNSKTGNVESSNKVLDTNTTNLNRYVSPYLEPVNIPVCNAKNPEVQFISDKSELYHLNDPSKRIFCFKPGDYGKVWLTESGTKEKRRYIILDNGNNIHPGKLEKNQLAKLVISMKNVNYWTIDRMAFWDSKDTTNPIKIDNSDHNIINRYFMDNVGNGIYLYPGSDFNTIQNCRIQRDDISIFHDRAAIGLNSNTFHLLNKSINITNNKIINNEIYNFVDGFQAIRSGWIDEVNQKIIVLKNINYEGTIIDGNHIHIDNTIYTNCHGKHDPLGSCAYAENGIDIKVGSDNSSNPMIITNNKMWGFRTADKTNSSLDDPGTIIPIHYNAKNIVIKNNYLFDATVGITISDSASMPYSAENLTITDNTISNIKRYGIYLSKTKNITIANNIFKKFQSINQDDSSSKYWLMAYKTIATSLINNDIIETDNRIAGFGDISEQKSIAGNNLYNSMNGDLPSSGFKYLQIKPEEYYHEVKFLTDKFTKYPKEITIK